MNVVRFWMSHGAEVRGLLLQHLMLVLVSTVAAMAIGIPAGIFAARRPRLGVSFWSRPARHKRPRRRASQKAASPSRPEILRAR